MLTMKKISIVLCTVITSLICCISANAQEITMIKSYYQQETGGGGQVPMVSEKMAEVITFYDNGFIKDMQGNVWRFKQNALNGNRIYGFVRNEGFAMPNTYYQTCVFSSDYSMMQKNYTFGIMGMMMQQYSLYRYLGEGSQPAYDWMSGNY